MSGTSYDNNGNVLYDTFDRYTWDAEGKPLTTLINNNNNENWSFTYDAFGHKVEASDGTFYEDSYINVGKFSLRAVGQTGDYSEYPLPGGSTRSFNGGGAGFNLADWLGTQRAQIGFTGAGYQGSWAYAPFGEPYAFTSGYPKDFTGQPNDSVALNPPNTDLTNYFPERNYRASQGRWSSPDPAGLAAADPNNPQSWNAYAYVLNNPLGATDPLGLFKLCPPGSSAGSVNPDGTTNCGPPVDLPLESTPWSALCLAIGVCGSQAPVIPPSPPPPAPPILRRKTGKLTAAQCQAARTLLAREARYGTTIAAFKSAIGFGDGTVQPFNSANTAPINTPVGPVKLDWYTDIQATGPAFSFGVGNSIAYAEGKLTWTGVRLLAGAPITNYLPFTDPTERNSLVQTFSPFSHFSDIFTPAFIKENCK